jgi:hypothetical protein
LDGKLIDERKRILMEALATAKGAERQCLLRLANALKSTKNGAV